MRATDSHRLPKDRTDIRVRQRRERWEERWRKNKRTEDPASLFSLSSSSTFHPLPPSPLPSPPPTVFTMPFQYKMRIKLPLHIRHGFPFSRVKSIWNAVHNIPMTTVMYCTNTHWIRRMIRTKYGGGTAGEKGGDCVHTPPSFSVFLLQLQLRWQVFHKYCIALIKLSLSWLCQNLISWLQV